MTATEQQTKMAARLYECRDAAKTLLGEKYRERMDELGMIIRKLASSRKCDVLAAATAAARSCTSGFDQVQILAAAIELVEPCT